MYQSQPPTLNPFQQTVPPSEGEIPFFEDAFDTESLKKFYQEHDSPSLESPSTFLDNVRSYSEPQSSTYSTKSIFDSPIGYYQKSYEKMGVDANQDIPKRIPFRSEDLFGRSNEDSKGWTFDEDLDKLGRVQKVVSTGGRSDDSRAEIIKGINRITINVAGRPLSTEQNGKMAEEKAFGFMTGDLDTMNFDVMRKTSTCSDTSFSKKAVFTIEKTVRPKVIEKIEKVKIKSPTLAKKNSDATELLAKVERKNSAKNGEKVSKKDSLDILKIERKLSKDSATSAPKKITKQKSKKDKEDV